MAPVTEFESTGGASWTSLDSEQTFLEIIATETDAVLSTAGVSLQQRPLWRLDLGTDTNGTWLIVAMVHANEQAAREAALQFARDLAYSQDQGIIDYLAAHRVVVMPDCNPDGFALGQRHNADGVDINRDGFALASPECRTIVSVMREVQPHLVLDCHERITTDTGIEFEYHAQRLLATYEGLRDKGDDFTTVLEAHLTGEAISHDPLPNPGRRSIREYAGINHATGYLYETVVTDDPLDRVSWYVGAMEVMQAWHETEAADLTSLSAASRNYQATTSDQYILQTGDTALDGAWPQTALPADLVGYRLTGGLAPAGFTAYGVTVSQGNIVELAQQARAVVPILLDSQSNDVQAVALRLTTIPPPASVASVQEFAEVVYGSVRMVAEAWVLSTFQTGNNPVGVLIDILGGDVTFDATAEIFATLELETSGLDERRRSRFPRRAGDLLAPYGTEVFCRRGVDLGPTILWSPLGYFRLNDDEQAPASDSPIRLSGQDRMSGIVDARLVIPRQYRRTRTFADVVSSLVTDVYPSAVITFDDDSGEQQIGRTLLVEEDRYAALLDLAESLGKVIFWDGEGVLRIEDAPDPDDLVWSIKAGHHGVLIDVQRRVSREGMANAIVARGEGGDTQNPVQAIVVDDGPNSPTRWFPPEDPTQLWFGQVPEFYSSPLLTTEGGAVSAGTSLLRRRIGLPYTVEVRSQVNPALRPRQAVRVVQKDGTRERHLMETVTIPLVYGHPLTGATREQTNVRISQVKPSSLAGGG